MTDMLSITGQPILDDRIVKIETHTYNPYANATFGYSDEIRIPIQLQDQYTLPCDSFLYIEGRLKSKASDKQDAQLKLANNCVAFMFDEIRYEIDGVEIDRNRNVGITSTMKNYASLTSERAAILYNAGWDLLPHSITSPTFDFNFCVPLNLLLGFKRVIINARHELIMI